MPAHTVHENLPGFKPDQLLVDGCPECERRGKNLTEAMGNLDAKRVVEAWRRAYRWQVLGDVIPSSAEAPMLSAMWSVQVLLERVAGLQLGQLPMAPRVARFDDRAFAACSDHLQHAVDYVLGGRSSAVKVRDVKERDEYKCSCEKPAAYFVTEAP